MVNRVFHRKLRRDIARQWSQFAAVMLVVAIASAVYVGASDAYTNLRDSFDRAYVDLRLPDVVVSGDKALKVPDGLPGEPIMSARYSVDLAIRVQGHALMGRLVSLPDGTQPEVGRLAVLSGNLPRRGEAMVERHLADYFGLLAGQSVELLTANGPVEVKVSGTGLASEYFWPARSSQELMTTPEQFGVLFVSESVIAAVAPNVVSQGAWYVRDRAQVDAVTAALRSAAEADGLTVLTRAEQPSFVALDQDVKTFGDFAVMLPMAFLIAGALGAYILLSRLVHSQRAVIGTLTANGIRARTLRRHYLGYGVVAGLGRAIPGGSLLNWKRTAAFHLIILMMRFQ